LEPRRQIMIIDNETSIRQGLRAFLERAGFDVSSASDGQSGLALHTRHPADLIVLDVLMPRLDSRSGKVVIEE
jgi:DNA-binding response OmpR family regulator